MSQQTQQQLQQVLPSRPCPTLPKTTTATIRQLLSALHPLYGHKLLRLNLQHHCNHPFRGLCWV